MSCTSSGSSAYELAKASASADGAELAAPIGTHTQRRGAGECVARGKSSQLVSGPIKPAPRPTPLRGPLYTRLALPFFRRDMDAGAARTTSSSRLTQLFAEDGSVQGTTLLSKELIHQFCEKRIPEQDALKQIPADMAKDLLERLNKNGIFYLYQLQQLALHGKLNDVLDCVGVTEEIGEMFDLHVAEKRRERKCSSFFLSLSGNLDVMESTCKNYGLVSALVLTMTFANFASITKEDWDAYRRLELENPGCQSLAINMPDDMFSENHLGWRKLYCLQAYQALVADPTISLVNTTMAGCLPVIKCAMLTSWNRELAFAAGNGGGSTMLLLVVLYAAWLYISLHATKCSRERYEEAKLLTRQLQNEFLILHSMFVLGIGASFFGIFSVMGIKASTYFMSWLVTIIGIAGGIIAFGILVSQIWEIFWVNVKVDRLRKKPPRERAKFIDNMSKLTGHELDESLGELAVGRGQIRRPGGGKERGLIVPCWDA